MANVKVTIEAGTTIKALHRLKKNLKNVNKALRRSGLYMERQTKLRFAKQRDPDGKAWEPLKPSTLRRKKTRAILRETGALAASISVVGPSGSRVRVVAGQAYGIYHQTGTKKMPARKFLGINEENVTSIKKIFVQQLES